MNRINKNLSIGRYFCYINAVILLLCGLTFLLSSCDGLSGGHSSSGEMTSVRFSLNYNSSCGEVPITRGLNAGTTEPETVVIPVGDNLYMYATLKEDPANGMRSCEDNLVEGSKICIVAYKDNLTTTTFTSTHTVMADGSLDPGDLEVEEDGIYTFVAFGYNDGGLDLPFLDDNCIIFFSNPAFEFVCGIVPGVVVDNSFYNVHIPMKRMNSKVKVEATTYLGVGDYQGFQDMGPVYITPYFSTPAMALPEGAISHPGTEAPLELADWDLVPPATTTTSESQSIVPPGFFGGQIRVEFTSFTIGGTQFPKEVGDILPAAHFYIEPNKNYTLQVRFSALEFAVSNIYWDELDEKLTFEPAISDGGIMGNPDKKQTYQGVYFKFGSLVGMSPREGNFVVGMDAVDGTDGTPLYVPDDIAARTWKKTNTATAYGADATWNSILAASSGVEIARDPNNRFVMEAAQNQPDKLANWIGDICQYINNAYRLPTAYELWGAYEGDFTNYAHYYPYANTSSGWALAGDWSAAGEAKDCGTGCWEERGATLRGAYFPAAEYITGTGPTAVRTSYWEGAYWSGSMHVDFYHSYGAYVKFSYSLITLGDFFFETDRYGLSVRCVKK